MLDTGCWMKKQILDTGYSMLDGEIGGLCEDRVSASSYYCIAQAGAVVTIAGAP
jgi:hypothetical protein